MTVPATPRIAGPYLGTAPGTTGPFPFTYPIFYTSDVLVVKNVSGVLSTLTLNSDYTVSMNSDQTNNPGGTVTLSAAIYTGTTVTLGSQVAQTQSTTLTNLGGFLPSVINNALDKLTILIQQLTTTVLGALSFPLADGNAVSGTLPAQTLRINGGAGSYLFFDGLVGAPGVSSGISSVAVSTALSPVVQAATLGAAAEQLLYGNIASSVPSIVDTNVWSQSTTSVNSYAQDIIQNTSNGAAASTDFVINNNLGTSTTYYGNFGMNSSGYTGAGSFNLANAVYLTSTSGDLAIGTTTANAIHFVYNGSATDAMTINASGVTAPVLNSTTATITNAVVSNMNTGQIAGFRNRIINGDMRIDQRNAGAAQNALGTTNVYLVDRFMYAASQAGKFNAQQNMGAVTPPPGFTNYEGFVSTSAYAPVATDYFNMQQRIEGFNVADLAWGTANAAPITLSFRVYSSLTGTFSGTINNSAFNRSYPFTYSIPVANTWTTISVTIPGDTAGTWLTNNGIGLVVLLGLGAGSNYLGAAGAWAGANYAGATGSVNVVATNGATFYVTGVQVEKGSVATPFEQRTYGHEFLMAARYFEILDTTIAGTTASGSSDVTWPFKAVKRAVPTIVQYTGSTGIVYGTGTGFTQSNISGGTTPSFAANSTATAEL